MGEITGVESADHSAPDQVLHAGPIRMKFADGQLRYIRVGDKEIVRRIYFGVRDDNWETAMPTYSKMAVESAKDHFTVHLAADCKTGAVDYSWTGADRRRSRRKSTFTVEGVAGRDFESNRIGLCVLYGECLVGRAGFSNGWRRAEAGRFRNWWRRPKLVAEKFHLLKYSTADGLHVSCSVEGATFDMEDQRNWGDSSWKAYAPLPYAYKHVGKGDRKSQTVTLIVSGVIEGKAIAQDPVHVKIGGPIDGIKLPSFTATPATVKGDFSAINFNRDEILPIKNRSSGKCIPTTHLAG